MIRFSHTYKTYPGPTHALRDINLNIDKGEFVYLTGPSGTGKTTLFRLISAFLLPSSRTVEVAGYNLSKMKPTDVPLFRRRIGVIYQDFRLLQSRTVFENVALPLEIRGERPGYIDQRVKEMIDSVGLYIKKDVYPCQLSGGEQQRVAIARALIHHPSVLIADEPTGNLDPDLSEDIIDLLDKVNAQGTTVFVATHDHDLVRRTSKRTIHIEEGQVVSGAKPFLNQPSLV
ncbi:MAG: cell division ATP-binding protein FtsE [Bdellovibrionales bacterium]|nr:cell division ATP-binding protein FtsE [Bdellovibrionales bacterium]